jgi:hypothetical protein
VQSLDYHDRGLWFQMLCHMHESEERGKLVLNGQAIPDESLAQLRGLPKQELELCLTRLLHFGVASREEETGIIYSRRMVRDECVRQEKVTAGSKGGKQRSCKQKRKQTSSTRPSKRPSKTGVFIFSFS